MHSPDKLVEKLKENIRTAYVTPDCIFVVQTILHIVETKNDILYQLLSQDNTKI